MSALPRTFRRVLLVLLLVATGCFGEAQPAAEEAPAPAKPISPSRLTPEVQVVRQLMPSVVNIETAARIRRSADPFRGFFGRSRTFTTQSVGSGFVWAKDGIIVTNAHVVEGASSIVVNLDDGRRLEANVIGVDPDSDLAVLQVDAGNLPAAPIGTSSDLLIGEPVLAIGNPFGLTGTVTRGVLSAVGRSVPSRDGEHTYTDFLQTDASINPGNSGGPLVNIEGNVIGINVAIYAEAQGIGFAIPVDRAKKIIEDLRRYGSVRPVWVGFTATTLTPEEARRLGLRLSGGAIITRVFDDSPAERAGLREGDVIVGAGGTPIDSRESLNTMLAAARQGELLELRTVRDGTNESLRLTPVDPPDDLALDLLYQISGIRPGHDRRSVYVDEVAPGSRADRIGLTRGDRIVGINGRTIRNIAELEAELLQSLDRSSILLSIGRGRYVYTLTFPMSR